MCAIWFNFHVKKMMSGGERDAVVKSDGDLAGRMAQLSRELAAPPGDQRAVPSAQARRLAVACNCSSRELGAIFWHLWAAAHTHTNGKINLYLKRKKVEL